MRSPAEPPPRLGVRRRNVLLPLVLMAGFAELGYATLNISAMPVYLRDELELGESTVTAVGALFLFTEAVLKAPMGMFSDRFGRHRFLTVGPFLTVWTALISLMVRHPIWFLLLRAVDGLGAAMLWPAAFATIGDVVEEKDRAGAMSLLNLTYMLGIALGPLVGGAVNDLTGTKRASFYLIAILFLMTTVIALRFLPTDDHTHSEHKEDSVTLHLRVFWQAVRLVPGYLLLAFVVFLGIGLVMLLVKLFALDEFHLSETQFGALLLFPALLMGLFSVPIGRLADRIGRARAVHWGLWGGAVALWAIATQTRWWLVMIAAGVAAISFLLALPAWLAEISEVDPKRRGVLLGAAGTAQGLGSILGALVGGVLYEHVPILLGPLQISSHRTPFLGCALLLTLGASLSLWVVRQKA